MLDYSPMPAIPTVVLETAAVEARLHKLCKSLTEEILLEANQRGYEARLEATHAHARTAAGTMHWHAFVGALRTRLAQEEWRIVDHKNCPFILSPDGRTAIALMTGNSDTGKPHGNPTNQAEKGAVLSAAILKNAQLQLLVGSGGSDTRVWVLLYHAEQGVNGVREIRSELSLASEFKGRKIVGWSERIILSSIMPGDTTPMVAPLPSLPFDVVVERKTGT